MSSRRIARILNGTLVLIFSVLSVVDERFIWLMMFMGISLVFSGVFDLCGFAVILERFRATRQ